MKISRIKTIPFLFLAFFLLTAESCESNSTANQERKLTEANQERLLAVQPPVQLDWSLEREQLNRRTNLWNDQNKVAYIYLFTFGKCVGYYVIKGKVSSVNSQITNPSQLVSKYKHSEGAHAHVMPSPAEDGSYGSNGDAVFFFTTSGTYVEWNDSYLLTDQPVKIDAPDWTKEAL